MGLEGHVTRTTQSGLNRQSFGVKDHSQPQDTWTNQVFRPLWQCGEASGMQSEREPKAYSYTRFSTPEQAKGDSSTRQALAAQQWAEARGVELDAELTFRDEGVTAYDGSNVGRRRPARTARRSLARPSRRAVSRRIAGIPAAGTGLAAPAARNRRGIDCARQSSRKPIRRASCWSGQ